MAGLISLDTAERIVEACRAEAESVGQPMNIAVVDDGANLLTFTAMEDRTLIGADISQKKVLTAVYFHMETIDLAPLVQPGQPLYGIEATSQGRLVVFAGAVLLEDDHGSGRRCGRGQRRHRGRGSPRGRGRSQGVPVELTAAEHVG